MKLTNEQFERMRNKWNFSFVHLKYEWEDLDKIPEDIKIQCKEYVENFTLDKNLMFELFKGGEKPGLFIYSPLNGTGKTSIIHQIAKDLIIKGVGIKKLYNVAGLELFVELKKTFNNKGEMSESELLEAIMECDILFLDDLDKIGTLSEYEKKRLTYIIDKRYTALRPVIITANKSISEMAHTGQLESHLYSRLVQMCREIKLETKEDFRLAGTLKIKLKERFV
jgi:DNA replication protein DnaC